jgi:hypothetical protein
MINCQLLIVNDVVKGGIDETDYWNHHGRPRWCGV